MNRRSTDGFSLIELVLAISILSMIFLVVSTAYILTIKVSDEDTQRFSDSQDGAITSAYWIRDVQSAKVLSTSSTPCNGTGSLIASATWDDVEGAPQKVEYRTTVASGLTTVTRIACGTPASTIVVANHLSSAHVNCSTACATWAELQLSSTQDGTVKVRANRRLP